MSTTPVDLWVDPTCPFAWMTSRWLHEVAERRPIEVRWRLMSLLVLHETDGSPAHGTHFDAYWRAMRVLAAAERLGGAEALGRLYTAMGTRIHPGGAGFDGIDDALIASSIQEAGLPTDLMDAADDASLEEAIRTSHAESQDAVGTQIGTPIVRVAGRAFFGPVVNPTPRGEDAARLFDAVAAMAEIPAFAELKRGRDPEIRLG